MTPQSYEYFLVPQFFLWKERLERGSWDSRGVTVDLPGSNEKVGWKV
jgi:hypothetical protein